MALTVHRAGRADLLVEGLARMLAAAPDDPFATELVIVPAKGVERWLSQQLSHRLGPSSGRGDGVCAGVEFRSPASLIGEVLGRDRDDPWAPDALAWPLLAVIDESVGEPWCSTLATHLGEGFEGEERELRAGRRYAVARRLAHLFSSYAAQRPGLLRDWESGTDSDGAGGSLDEDLAWQPELWRRLVRRMGIPSPLERHRQTCERLVADPASADLPPRLSFFGHTRFSRTDLALVQAIAEHREVHLWIGHPSDALWSALADLDGVVPRDQDESHLLARHPLLAGMGRDVREFERLLGDVDGDWSPAVHPPTLLGQLQSDLAANALPEAPRLLAADSSISVHACHGPSRQVEVLREVIVGLLEDDPSLEPRDILVMCPDIEAYAPLIAAAFGMGDLLHGRGHPGQDLRVQLADRALTQTNPLLAVSIALLDLASGRAEARDVLDLVALDPVRRRFGFTDDHLERLSSWVGEAGIKWALDADGRSSYGLGGIVQNTWAFGLDRLLTGVAVAEDVPRWFGHALPLDDVGSTDIELAGRLAELIDRLGAAAAAFSGSHPIEHWIRSLLDAIESVAAVGLGDEWQLAQVHSELGAVADRAESGTDLRLADVRALLEQRFAGRPTRANFRTGALTVCTMTPMRSVPHRVVCLLGLDDGVFPRAGAVDGDDVLARRPLTGERDPRSEDRQLMLDAVLAARDHLVITYTGAHESSGQTRPPAVPLHELLDALDRTATVEGDPAGHAVVRRHPLQAFDARNLEPGAPFSFDRAALAGAQARRAPRQAVPTIADLWLPAPEGDIDLAELVAFVKAPVRCFLRRRLEIALPDKDEDPGDAIPVELDGLESWQVGDRMLRDLARGATPDEALQMVWRRGLLPPGRLGWRLAGSIRDQVVPIATLADAVTAGLSPRAVDVDLPLPDGRRITGTVNGLHDTRLVATGYSKLGPKQELDAWVQLVVLECAQPGRGWSAGAIGRGREGAARVAFGAVEDAPRRLAELVALYDAGMRGPIPLPVKTAQAYALRRRRSNADSAAWAARKEWEGDRFDGESAEPEHRRVWGDLAFASLMAIRPRSGEEWPDEESRFGTLARRLWEPVLAARSVS